KFRELEQALSLTSLIPIFSTAPSTFRRKKHMIIHKELLKKKVSSLESLPVHHWLLLQKKLKNCRQDPVFLHSHTIMENVIYQLKIYTSNISIQYGLLDSGSLFFYLSISQP